MAFSPRSGCELCAARPDVWQHQRTTPLCATTTRNSVGSATPGPTGGALLRQARKGGQHRRHAPFDVACTAAVDAAVAQFGRKRIDRHAVDGHRVLMRLEPYQ